MLTFVEWLVLYNAGLSYPAQPLPCGKAKHFFLFATCGTNDPPPCSEGFLEGVANFHKRWQKNPDQNMISCCCSALFCCYSFSGGHSFPPAMLLSIDSHSE